MADDLDSLRQAQSDAVMPLIGGLLDAWEGIPNDFLAAIQDEAPMLAQYLCKISVAMEGQK